MILKTSIHTDPLSQQVAVIAPRRAKNAGPAKARNLSFTATVRREPALALDGTATNWRMKVVANLFPAFNGAGQTYGKQEVIVETPDPKKRLADLPVARLATLFRLYAERIAAHRADPNIKCVVVFKNEGLRAGASILQAHSQLIATAFVPPWLRQPTSHASRLRNEMHAARSTDRFVAARAGIAAFCPTASRYSYETWLMPERPVARLEDLTDKELVGLTAMLHHFLKRLRSLDLPYNYGFHELTRQKGGQFALHLTPRLTTQAGYEVHTGAFINPIAPAQAAAFFRKRR